MTDRDYLEECWEDLKNICEMYPDDEELKGIFAWRTLLAAKEVAGCCSVTPLRHNQSNAKRLDAQILMELFLGL